MSIFKKAWGSTLIMAFMATSFSVQAQDASSAVEKETTKPRAVLFKVHDITPVENTEGVITHCDFLVTFYNRTTDSLRQAKIDMGWTDTVTERYMIDESSAAKPESSSRVRNSRNAEPYLGEITTSVEMPALGAYKQTSVKGSVKTEKCFLLLDNLEFNVVSCNIVGQSDSNDTSRSSRRTRVASNRNTSECASLFEYVNSKNPEYYDEFKNVSYSEQERLLKDEKKQDINDIESTYETIVSNFEKANEVINNIK